MGRGRQKAKHTKVARELKYFSPDTNYGALERELSGSAPADDALEKWPEYAADCTRCDAVRPLSADTASVDRAAAGRAKSQSRLP